jgi:hypothetical protein
MATVQSPRISCINWLDEGPLAPHGQAYKQYLIDRACAASTFGNGLGGVAHFVQWLGYLPPLPSLRYGATKCEAIRRTSRPMARSRRAPWWAPPQAFIATTQPGGNCAYNARN